MKPPGLLSVLTALLRRDVLLGYRRRADLANPLLFFLMVIVLFPLGLGPEPARLAAIAPGVLWVVALLASLLATETLFRSDFDDGSLEQQLLAPASLYAGVLGRALAHWLLTGLPLTLISPVLALLLNLAPQALWALLISLALGSGVFSLIGAIGAALTVGLRRGGLLLALIVLPLYVPVLIFGSSAVSAAAEGAPWLPQVALIGAQLVAAVVMAPLAISAALRISVDN